MPLLPDGVLAIDKPTQVLSTDVVLYLRHLLTVGRTSTPLPTLTEWQALGEKNQSWSHQRKRRRQQKTQPEVKVGHGGTLDPLASGVLIMGVGKGTKLLSHFLTGPCRKVYVASGQLGKATDTYDVDGKVVLEKPFTSVTKEKMEAILANTFTGSNLLQRPPAFSALKVNGQRMYDRARQLSKEGQTLPDLPARPVSIFVNRLESFEPTTGVFKLHVECGSGTYIRSIVHDLGLALDSCAHMTALRRITQGPFSVAPVEGHRVAVALEKVPSVLERLDEFLLTEDQLKTIGFLPVQGKTISPADETQDAERKENHFVEEKQVENVFLNPQEKFKAKCIKLEQD